MKTYMQSTAVLLGFLTVGLVVTASGAAAQASPSAPVFLAMPQEFPDLDARAVLMLEPGRDIVVLDREDAGPETLDVALGVLERMRRDHPRQADRGQLVPITGFVYRGTPAPPDRACHGRRSR